MEMRLLFKSTVRTNKNLVLYFSLSYSEPNNYGVHPIATFLGPTALLYVDVCVLSLQGLNSSTPGNSGASWYPRVQKLFGLGNFFQHNYL